MNPLAIHPEAATEIEEAADFYEANRPGYGEVFRAAVQARFDQVAANPNTIPLYRSSGCRRCKLNRFPHYLYFLEVGPVIWVVAVEHPSREKGYWLHRLDDIRGTNDTN